MKINKNIWIIGLGLFGNEIVEEIIKNGYSPNIIDKNKEKLMNFKNTNASLFSLDTEIIKNVEELEIEKDDVILITLGQHFESSILTCQNFLELGYKNIFVQATNNTHEKILKTLGVKNLIRPYKNLSKILFKKIINNYELIFNNDYCSIIKTTNKLEWKKTLDEYNLREKYKINILLIERNSETIIPEKNTKIQKDDSITFLVPNKNINQTKKLFN